MWEELVDTGVSLQTVLKVSTKGSAERLGTVGVL